MQEADHILIPLLDGHHALAQVARVERGRALLMVSDRISAPKAKVQPLMADDVVAKVVVAPSDIPAGHWPTIGYDAVPRIAAFRDISLPTEDATDLAIVEALANALHGLYPWDGFPEPDFFVAFLRDNQAIPAKARMTAQMPKPDSP